MCIDYPLELEEKNVYLPAKEMKRNYGESRGVQVPSRAPRKLLKKFRL